eukprot:TRINITY_DN1918_c3_g1_i1.p2 TRINITY_DN1918_c3_g1~~TRINITY_DN1918_c3_g1_i1.p2  ORF type:complete len:183 (+),score=44.17 TRINITY_DN1918_c3_g1_i1:316-864(+)
MAAERERVAALLRGGERVLELFAGIGAQAVRIAARIPDARVDCIELGASAAALCRANARRNNVAERLRVFEADVRDATDLQTGLRAEGYDVVLCPRPEGPDLFLVEAARWARPGGRVHWYFVGSSDELDSALARGLPAVPSALHGRLLQERARRRCPRRSVGSKGRYRWAVDLEVMDPTNGR